MAYTDGYAGGYAGLTSGRWSELDLSATAKTGQLNSAEQSALLFAPEGASRVSVSVRGGAIAATSKEVTLS